MKFFEHILYELDMFKAPFFFRIKGSSEKLSTKLGSILSIIIVLCLMIIFSQSDMILKTNPSVISQTNSLAKRLKINLEASLFKVKFGIYDNLLHSYPIDSTIFSIEFGNSNVFIDPNNKGNRMTQLNRKNISECIKKGVYCVSDDLQIEGYIDEPSSSYLYLYLRACDNETSLVMCKSQEEIDIFFSDKNLGITFQNSAFDFNDYNNPIHNTSSTEYIILDSRMSKTLNIFIKKAEFKDDNNPFFSKPKLIETYLKDYSQSDFTQNVLINKSTPIAQIRIFSSNNLLQNTRVYQKIDQVFANLSGIANFLIIIGFFLVKFEQNLNFQNYILKDLYDLYDYNQNEDEKPKQNANHNDFSEVLTENKELCIFKSHVLESQNQHKIQLEKIKEKKLEDSFILENFSQKEINKTMSKQKNSNPIEINVFQYLKLKVKLFIKYPLNSVEKNFIRSQKEFYNITNLKFILKLLQNLEKLKIIYFNLNQLKLFELLPSSIISNEPYKQNIMNKASNLIFLSRKYQVLSSEEKMEMRKKIISEFQKKNTKDDIDGRLLSFFPY